MANKHGKKYLQMAEKVDAAQVYAPDQALKKIKELAFAKFDESVDVDVNLGIDPTKGEQVVRGSVVLPHTVGKKPKVLVFAKGEHAEQATKAGADFVGVEDLIQKIEGGWMDFDYAVATPDLMGIVGKVAKILGPRGLLPNKKLGTVTFDVAEVISDLKSGKKFFKNDKSGLVHFTIGKVSLEPEKLAENLTSFLKALASAKPSSAKGKFLKKLVVSSTMGKGIQIDPDYIMRTT